MSKLLEKAKVIALSSNDTRKKVGCVIYKGNKLISSGYNLIPDVIENRFNHIDVKNDIVIHAEVVAFLNCLEPTDGCTMAITFPPCSKCASIIIYKGIKKVITTKVSPESKWFNSCMMGIDMLKIAGIEVCFEE